VLKYIRNKAAYQVTVRDLLSHVEKASLITMGFKIKIVVLVY